MVQVSLAFALSCFLNEPVVEFPDAAGKAEPSLATVAGRKPLERMFLRVHRTAVTSRLNSFLTSVTTRWNKTKEEKHVPFHRVQEFDEEIKDCVLSTN